MKPSSWIFVLIWILFFKEIESRGDILFLSIRDGKSQLYTIDEHGRDLEGRGFSSGQARISPDGLYIIGASGASDVNTEIYRMNWNGTNRMNMTNHPATDQLPAWSPDGRQIAFVSNRESRRLPNGSLFEDTDIYVMNADGSNVRRLTNGLAVAEDPLGAKRERSPSWSPDGTQIAYLSERHTGEQRRGNYGEIYVMDADGRNQKRLTNLVKIYKEHPVWSPDGTQIAFQLRAQIAVMNADGSNVRFLTEELPSPQGDTYPTWSPDGRQIAFQRNLEGGNDEIFVMNADGTEVRNLTNHPSHDLFPDWSRRPSATALPSPQKLPTVWGRLKTLRR